MGSCCFCQLAMYNTLGRAFKSCGHVYCRECLQTLISICETDIITCMGVEGCSGYLEVSEASSVLEVITISPAATVSKEESVLLQNGRSKTFAGHSLLKTKSTQKRTCSFCCMELDRQEGTEVTGCLHILCGDCFHTLISMHGSKPIPCPVLENEDIKCRGVIKDADKEEQKSNQEKKEIRKKVSELKVSKEEMKMGWYQLALHVDHLIEQGMTSEEANHHVDHLALLVTNQEIDCPICFTDIPSGQGVILKECLHSFCMDCLQSVVKHSEEAVVKCPYQDGDYACDSHLKPREVNKLVPKEILDSHLAKSVKAAEGAMVDSFHCKTPDCINWWEILNKEEVGLFLCNICNKNNCFKCKVIHENETCADYENRLKQDENAKLNEDALQAILKAGEGMRCSKCQIVVQKIAGCDYLQCPVCRTELCWATKGPRWGVQGRGDTSGGCRCGVDGKPCTPNCGNCH